MKDKGACMVKDAMNLFKDKILDQYGCTIDYENHWKILGKQLATRGYRLYFPTRQSGSMYYDYFQGRDLN